MQDMDEYLLILQTGCGISNLGNIEKANRQGSEKAQVTSKLAVL